MTVLLKAQGLSKTFKGNTLFENVTFDVSSDNCIGVLGLNGSGKTTLFRMLLGWEPASTGEIWYIDNIRMRYIDQAAISPLDKTVYDFFIRTTQSNIIMQQIKTYEKQLGDPKIYHSPVYEEILENIRRLRVSVDQTACKIRWEAACRILSTIGLKNLSKTTRIDVLSGGEQQKIALASVFAQPKDCDILFLDEPTNHLDIETIEWLERQIVDFPHAVMIISHDRYLLDDLVDRVFDIQGCCIEIFNSTFDKYEEEKRLRQHVKVKEYEKSQIEIKRQKAVVEVMSRRNRYDRQIASKMKRLRKKQHVENPVLKSYLLKFRFKTLPKSGKNVVEGHDIIKRFDDKIILNHANFEILAGQKICLIGPNGCGKTTFLKILIKEEDINGGAVHMSSGVRLGYFDQGHLSLNLENNLIDEVCRDQQNLSENDAKALLGQFNFKGDMIFHQVKHLSGGERGRLAILRLIMKPYNFLILDEPTNHMDIDSKVAIESALNSYTGTVITVSHDRRFLDVVADTIFFMDKASIKSYQGNYTSFRLQRQKELIQLSDPHLAYLSGTGLTKYIVCKSFTSWTTKTKHKVGDVVFIGDHNEKIYEWAIKGKLLQPEDKKRTRK
jgi:ATP-binding cassette subfamily F protein 3